MKKMNLNLTREQAQRFCDPIIDFLQRNPEIAKKIQKEIQQINHEKNKKLL
ncbi:hypothetical protein [Bacillus bingmayongensis]|uniref:hypothetical protein n=1 Tax=Bacillus bingmayongensis TaxID=1150157 RepID=UPI001C8F15E1|nr:hypothetical protein [Bacillus bingmayongensis]MBY0598760.1 hypothetical protein [Bacillus bingmayongensis]